MSSSGRDATNHENAAASRFSEMAYSPHGVKVELEPLDNDSIKALAGAAPNHKRNTSSTSWAISLAPPRKACRYTVSAEARGSFGLRDSARKDLAPCGEHL